MWRTVRYFIPRVFVHQSYSYQRQVVRYCTALHVDTTGALIFGSGFVRYAFGMRSVCVRDSFGMPVFLPASLHAGRSYGTVLHYM